MILRITMETSTLMLPGFTAASVEPPKTEPIITKPVIVARFKTTRIAAPTMLEIVNRM